MAGIGIDDDLLGGVARESQEKTPEHESDRAAAKIVEHRHLLRRELI